MASEIPLPMPKMSMTMETGELIGWSVSEGDTIKSGDVRRRGADRQGRHGGGVACRRGNGPDRGAARRRRRRGRAYRVHPQRVRRPDGGAVRSSAGRRQRAGNSRVRCRRRMARSGTALPAGRRLRRRCPGRARCPAVPLARRRAAELRVSLDDVRATGPGGVITVDDVEHAAAGNGAAKPVAAPAAAAAAPAAPAAPAAQPAVPPSTPARPAAAAASAPAPDGAAGADPGFADALAPRRRAIRAATARVMTASTAMPQFTVFVELDLEAASQARNKIGWTTLLMRGLARAIRGYPQVNAGWDPRGERTSGTQRCRRCCAGHGLRGRPAGAGHPRSRSDARRRAGRAGACDGQPGEDRETQRRGHPGRHHHAVQPGWLRCSLVHQSAHATSGHGAVGGRDHTASGRRPRRARGSPGHDGRPDD